VHKTHKPLTRWYSKI